MIADVAFSLRFERVRPTNTDSQAELRALRNSIGDVLENIVENNGNSGTFTFSLIRPAGACYIAAFGRTEDMPIHGWKIEVACVVQEGGQ
jgi:DNA/RNA endonuclease YhcR with UshA esterase domain